MMTFEEFAALAREHTIVLLTRTTLADLQTPVSVYLALREEGTPSFLFESVEPDEKIGRYSYVGRRPSMIIRSRENRLTVRTEKQTRGEEGNIFDFLQCATENQVMAAAPECEGFAGGFVGFLGYDNVSRLESITLPTRRLDDVDDAIVGRFDSVVQFDHRRHRITLVHAVHVDHDASLEEQYDRARRKLEILELKIRRSSLGTQAFACYRATRSDGMSKEQYCAAVRAAKEHIVAGDIFQVVLSHRTDFAYSGDLFAVYRALRVINPSPYLFYVDFGDLKLAGSSPEVLVRVHEGVAEVLPIAGTRPRGHTAEEDERLARELLADEKELAEHIMLVDLGRNDVGRVAEFGSVTVPVLKRIERYSHVMHIVSEVRGRLREGMNAVDGVRSCFPAGTVSGAPKVRAMEIISTLERHRRGVYAGAVGYLGFNGSLDTCIAIRTIVAHRGILSIQAGAGIVADSDPEREYQETLNKAQALLEAISFANGGFSYGPRD